MAVRSLSFNYLALPKGNLIERTTLTIKEMEDKHDKIERYTDGEKSTRVVRG